MDPQLMTLVYPMSTRHSVLLGLKDGSKIGNGMWDGPGGKVRPGQSLLDCAIQETREEFRIDGKADDLQKIALLKVRQGDTHTATVHVFRLARFNGTPHPADKVSRIKDFQTWQLPFAQMMEDSRYWLTDALRRQRFVDVSIWYRTTDKQQIGQPGTLTEILLQYR